MPIVQPLCQVPKCGLPIALTELAGEQGNTGPDARRCRKRKDNCTPDEWQQLLAKRRDQMRRLPGPVWREGAAATIHEGVQQSP